MLRVVVVMGVLACRAWASLTVVSGCWARGWWGVRWVRWPMGQEGVVPRGRYWLKSRMCGWYLPRATRMAFQRSPGPARSRMKEMGQLVARRVATSWGGREDSWMPVEVYM